MQTIEKRYTIRKINKSIGNGDIVFNHPMQRKPEQWDIEQQSLLIDSILASFAIPQMYAMPIIEGDFESFSVLDGKQRLTTIYDYMKDGFRLSKDMLPINRNINKIVTDENGQRRKESTVKEYEIAGQYFSELDEYLQEKLRDTEISVIMLIDATDEEIEEQFFRLNNGTALTKDQKTRVMLGDELALFIDRIEESELFSEKSKKTYFTSLQRKHGEIQTTILQTLMLVMDYPFKNFNNDTTMKFAKWFRENHKPSDLEYCEELFGKLNEALPKTEKVNKQMKKINIPMFTYHVQTVDEIGMSLERYGEWIQEFLNAYTPNCEYASLCGQGSTSKVKVMGRLEYIEKQLREVEKE